MPIVILQGSTKQEGKKIIKNAGELQKKNNDLRKIVIRKDENIDEQLQTAVLSPSSSKEEYTPIKDIATNMADVVDFKVYKVSKPHFVDGTTSVSLIGGDLFYTDDEVRQFSTNKTIDTGIMKQIQVINTKIEDKKKKKALPSHSIREEQQSVRAEVDEVWTDDEGAMMKKQLRPKSPTLLQKLRQFRYITQRKREDKSFLLQHIEEDNQRYKRVRAGQSLWDQMKEPTFEEVLEWAVKYITAHDKELVSLFVDLEERLKTYESEIVSRSKSPQKDKLKGSTTDHHHHKPVLTTNKFVANSGHHAINGSVHQSLFQQLENLKQQGTEAFLKAVDHPEQSSLRAVRPNNIQTKRIPHPPSAVASSNASSIQFSNSGSPISGKLSVGADSSKLNKKFGHVLHRNLANSAAESSVKSTHSPRLTRRSVMKGKSSFRLPTEGPGSEFNPTSSSPSKRSTLDVEDQPDDKDNPDEMQEIEEEKIPNIEEPTRSRFRSASSDISNATVSSTRNTLRKDKPILTSNRSGSGDEKEEGKETRARGASSEKDIVGKKPQAPSNKAKRQRPKVGFSVVEPNHPSSDAEKEKEKESSASPAKTQKPVKYSNAAIDNTNGGSKIDEINTATQQTIDVMRRGQRAFMKSMGFAMALFHNANQKQEVLEKKMENKIMRVQKNGNNMLKQLQQFNAIEEQYEERFKQLSKKKEIMKVSHVKAKLQFMDSLDRKDKVPIEEQHCKLTVSSRNTSPTSSQRVNSHSKAPREIFSSLKPVNSPVSFVFGEKNFLSDFQKMRTLTKDFEEVQALSAIYDIKWYLTAIYRVRDFMKRMNNNLLPTCLLKMLLIFQYMVMLQYMITIPMFYQILLIPDIFQKDDLRKGIVQEIILENVKVGLQISSEEFLAFLEKHGFQIPSELLNEVRNNTTAAAAAANNVKANSPRRNTVLSPQQSNAPKEMLLSFPPEDQEFLDEDIDAPTLVVNSEATIFDKEQLSTVKEGILATDD